MRLFFLLPLLFNASAADLSLQERNVIQALSHSSEYAIPSTDNEWSKIGVELYSSLPPEGKQRVREEIFRSSKLNLAYDYTMPSILHALAGLGTVEPKLVADWVLKTLSSNDTKKEWPIRGLYIALASTGDERGVDEIMNPLIAEEEKYLKDGYVLAHAQNYFAYTTAFPTLAKTRYNDPQFREKLKKLTELMDKHWGPDHFHKADEAARIVERQEDFAKYGYLSSEFIESERKRTGAKSIDELLPHLPPSFRRNVVAMPGTQSTQHGTNAKPRLFHYDRYFAMAYTGDEDEPFKKDEKDLPYRSYNRLEMIDHDLKGRRNITSETVFPDPKNKTISVHNPKDPHFNHDRKDCHDCHDGSMRMSPYADWSGAAPSFFSFSTFGQHDFFKEKFLTPNSQKGRYKSSPWDMYRDEGEAHNNLAEFNEIAMLNNAARLAKEVSQRKDFSIFAHVLMGLANACHDLKQFFPEELRKEFDAVYPTLRDSLLKGKQSALDRKVEIALSVLPDDTSKDEIRKEIEKAST